MNGGDRAVLGVTSGHSQPHISLATFYPAFFPVDWLTLPDPTTWLTWPSLGFMGKQYETRTPSQRQVSPIIYL